jgi:hypothetical protein
MSSLKIDEAVRILPEVNYNKAEAFRRVGFSKASCRSGDTYATLRKRLEKIFNPDVIKDKIIKAEAKFIKDGDNSNLMANLTLQAKILGLGKDSNATQVNVNINDTLARLKEDKPIDVSSSGTTG